MTKNNNLTFHILARLTHWILAICVIANLWITEEETLTHENIGITAFFVVLIRLAIARWIGAPKISFQIADYIHHIDELRAREFKQKYNPLAALMIWLMWVWVLCTALTGYLGYYYEWAYELNDVHELLAEGLQYLVILHFIAIGFFSLWCRRNLIKHMIFK